MRLRPRRGTGNLADNIRALQACAAFCMETESWPVFAAWVRAHPDVADLCAEGDDGEDTLWAHVEEGVSMMKFVQRIAPVVMRSLPGGEDDEGSLS